MKLYISKRVIISSFFIISLAQLKSQNLIINPSFEEFVNFDTIQSNCWHKILDSDTPDYFNLSDINPHNNIFNQYLGGVKPKSGFCFAGIFCYRVHPDRNIKNIREFIETPLSNTLEKDSLYSVELSLCLDAESNYAVKNFGVYFSNSPSFLNKDFKSLTIKPQIEFNASFLDSTNSWITLQSLFKANGTEKYITLGNFMPDKYTPVKNIKPAKKKGKREKWELSKKEKSAYYYIDDVKVEKISNVQHLPISAANIKTQPADSLFNIDDIKIDSSIVLKNIIFEYNKCDLMSQSYNEINKLYQLMVTNPTIRIKLEGHTDNIGGYDFNLRLSVKRVETVAVYLINQGIDSNRIEYAGYSYSFPIASNQTDEGRQINRRVVFKIIQK